MISKIALISERSMRDLAYADDGSGGQILIFHLTCRLRKGVLGLMN